MAVPEPTEVAPWYLRNITQALELDEATGNVSVGNVSIGDLGNIDISGNTMPVTIDSGNVTVYQGNVPWKEVVQWQLGTWLGIPDKALML